MFFVCFLAVPHWLILIKKRNWSKVAWRFKVIHGCFNSTTILFSFTKFYTNKTVNLKRNKHEIDLNKSCYWGMHWSSKKMQSGEGDLYHLSSCLQKCYFSIIQLIRMKAHNNCALCKIWTDNQINFMCKVKRKQTHVLGNTWSLAQHLHYAKNESFITGQQAPLLNSRNADCFNLKVQRSQKGI